MRLPFTIHRRTGPRGQVIVLVAFVMVVLIGFVGLAVDVGMAYAEYRYEKAVAEAASLAGGQDLQQPATEGGHPERTIDDSHRLNARTHALELLVKELGAGAPSCSPSADIVQCPLPGTPYVVSIHTPSLTCVDCSPNLAVQVTVEHPKFGLFFPRIFGHTDWDIGATSVAGINYGIRYGLVTLRPPDPNRNNTNDPNNCDVDVSGNGTRVVVRGGDIGSNTTACTSGANAYIELDSGYHIYHFNAGEPWLKIDGEPVGIRSQHLIADPLYLTDQDLVDIKAALDADGRRWASQVAGEDVDCAAAATWAPGADVPAGAKCYKPGIYPDASPHAFSTTVDAFLYPGVYYFEGSVSVGAGATLIGGNTSRETQPNGGVALIMAKDKTLSVGGTGSGIDLNRGPTDCADDGCRAGPAVATSGGKVMVAPDGTLITLIVERWPGCFNAGMPRLCTDTNNDNFNRSLSLQGSGVLYVAGIVYAPSDQVRVRSDNTDQEGTIGQIISWTVDYTGNTALNQLAFSRDTPGILRIDAACSRTIICNSP